MDRYFWETSKEIMTEERKQTFSEFCMHMYAENCHERREYGQKEYMSVEAYVDEGTNKEFLQQAYDTGVNPNAPDSIGNGDPRNWIS